MLTHFSSTIRQQFPDDTYVGHQQWPQHNLQQGPYHTPPVAVRLVGGDGRSIIDLVNWMTECCRKNALLPLRTYLNCPVRHILAMDAVQKLGVEHLSHELPQIILRLQYELFDVRTVGRLLSAGEMVLPQIMDAICHCVARYFFHGSLPEVDRWMSLARLNARFDQGVGRWLAPGALQEGADVLGAADLWERKVPSVYPAAWRQHKPPEPAHQMPYSYASPGEWPQAGMYQPAAQPPSHPNTYGPDIPSPHRCSHGPSSRFSHPHPPPSAPVPPPPPLPPKPTAYDPACYASQEPYGSPQAAYESYLPHRSTDPYLHYPNFAAPPWSPLNPQHHRPSSPVPDYTVRCRYCQEIHPQSAAAAHQCMTGRAYTVSDSTSPPLTYHQPHRASISGHRGRSVSRNDDLRGRSASRHDIFQNRWLPSQENDYRRSRSASVRDPSHRRRASTPYPQWDAAYEPPQLGEYLRERRQIGPEHFLHFFVDEYGRERVVNKSGEMSMEERPW
jgi:hypothetical protein